jgi:hypothetical protein
MAQMGMFMELIGTIQRVHGRREIDIRYWKEEEFRKTNNISGLF